MAMVLTEACVSLQVYVAYRSGVEALRAVQSSQGLTLRGAEEVRADMQELMEEGEEVAAVLAEGMTRTSV